MKAEGAAHLLPLVAALQQVRRLVVLQVADAGICSFAQQQPQDLLLVGVTMETGCHVQSRVAVSLSGTTGEGSVGPSQPRTGCKVFWRSGLKAR